MSFIKEAKCDFKWSKCIDKVAINGAFSILLLA